MHSSLKKRTQPKKNVYEMWEIAVPMHQNGTQHRLYWIKNEKEKKKKEKEGAEGKKKNEAQENYVFSCACLHAIASYWSL